MTLTSAEARKRWGEVLDAANRGDTVQITRRGRVVAEVRGPQGYPREVWRGTYAEHRERLRAKGLDLVGTPPIIPDYALTVATIQRDGGPEHYTVTAPTVSCANPTGYTTVRVSGG